MEFIEVMKQRKRMCDSCYSDIACSNCPGWIIKVKSNPERFERFVMDWAKEHPEPDSIFLFSKEELKKYKDVIPKCNTYWWLRSPGYNDWSAAFADGSGWVTANGNLVNVADVGIRPALRIDTSGKDVGEKISVNTYSFTVIDEGLAIATVPISFGMFDTESNEYQKSEVRKWLLEWYEQVGDTND